MNSLKISICGLLILCVFVISGFLQAEETQKDKILVLEPIWNVALSESEKEPIFDMFKAEADTNSHQSIVTLDSIKTPKGQPELFCDYDNLECLSDMGASAGASLVLFGSVDRIGEVWLINIKLVDVTTQTIVRRSSQNTVQKAESLIIGFTSAVKDIFDVEYTQNSPVLTNNGYNLSKWPYTFTQDEIETLEKSGALFTEIEKNVAQRIYNRGFSKDEYIQSYKDLFTIKFVNDSLLLEELVVFRYIGINVSKYQEYYNYWKFHGSSLAMYYNRTVHGGRDLVIGGWIMVSVGVLASILGPTVVRTENFDSCDLGNDSFNLGDCNNDKDKQEVMWPLITAIGGGLFVSGITMAAIGHVRKAKWAPNGFLATATKKEIDAYKIEISGSGDEDVYVPEEESKPSVSIAPVITSDTKGAFLEFRF